MRTRKRSTAGVVLILMLFICIGLFHVPAINAQTEQKILAVRHPASVVYISQYCYMWDGYEYVPKSPYDEAPIKPWTGFWVAVKKDIDLLIPKSLSPPAITDPAQASLTIDNDCWCMFSVPLDLGNQCDVNVNIGDDLGSGQYEQTWRVSKWLYNTEEYHHYNGVDPFEDLIPGRGFWLHQQTGSSKTIAISGSGYDPPSGTSALKLLSNGNPITFHMVGNPYWYDIIWKSCNIRIPATDSLPLGKIAEQTVDEIEAWHIGLKLISVDGIARDSYNRAGVLVTSGVDTDILSAFDMQPPGDYVRIVLKDPENPDREGLAYDYQAPDQPEYTWLLELSTNFDQVNTNFTIDNFVAVPENYMITLKNISSGEEVEISTDTTINVSLSALAAQTYLLTARRTDVNVNVEATQPVAFGITKIVPNPFNPMTTIHYVLEKEESITIKVFNLNGQVVETLLDTYMNAGIHSLVWNAKNHASGVYMVVMTANNLKDVKKIILLK